MLSEIAKRILIEELEAQGHIKPVENVIYWALQLYASVGPRPPAQNIADYIIQRIRREEEAQKQKTNE